MLNRQEPPFSNEIKGLKIKEAQTLMLNNGIDIYYLNAGNEDVIRLDIVFDAGINKQAVKSQASFTSKMLSEGTSKYTAAEIAQKLDFYGAYFQAKCNYDDAVLTLYCLGKHLHQCLPFIHEILVDSIFPEEDLNILKKNNIQSLLVNENKNSYLSRRAFNQTVFGNNSHYGSFSAANDIQAIDISHLKSFYQDNYQNGIKYILLSGLVSDDVLKAVSNTFSKNNFKSAIKNAFAYKTNTIKAKHVFIEKAGSVQNAIRIGKRLFNRNHPDFREMQLLNLILGGYFGSRLMKNIREEKGLTYGIYSAIEPYAHDACWYIDTEINKDLCWHGIDEILKEIKLLQTELISVEELQTAKNYLLGSFLRSIDGPFSLLDRFKILKDNNLSYTYYYDFIEIIIKTSSERLLELSNLYFKENELSQVVVGSQKNV
jgi:predicted Zn-dependent peptidase